MHRITEKPPDASIVIVDDVSDNLRLLFTILSEHGYRVHPLPGVRLALNTLEREPPDLLLLSVHMADMDGYAVCHMVKSNPQTRHIPIIFLATPGEPFDKVRAFALGAIDYITRPFEAEDVLARVSLHLSMERMQQQVQQQNIQLQQVNRQLAESVGALERRNREMDMLNRMSVFVQRAESVTEAIQLSLTFLQELFARYPGALYLLNRASNVLELAAAWGGMAPQEQTIPARECLAFAGTRMYLVEDPEIDLQCEHCRQVGKISSICVQLITRGEPLGMLHLRNVPVSSMEDSNHWQQLAMMVADHLALGLSNLRLREQLRERAIRDLLTGLFNRYYLDDTLERELSRALREEYAVGFMLMDIDHFKRYNDTYGHDAGDVLLQTFGAFLRHSVRREDIACRFGGEEFLLIMPGASLEETRQRAEKLCAEVRQMEVQHGGRPLGTITISVGVASFPLHGTTAAAMIATADDALYRAKASGRDQVIVSEG